MALNNVLTAGGPVRKSSLVQPLARLGDYANLINMISSGAFAFLPILVGYSSAKRFGGNVYLGAAMGAAMVSTSLLPASSMSDETARVNFWNYQATISNAADHWTLFGMHIDKIGYQSMVIPVLCVTWILSVIEKWLHKRLSGTTDFLLTPLATLLLTGFLAFVVIGPITREMSNWITDGLAWTYNTLGAIGGAFLGMTYSPIVVTGLHQSFPAIELPLIAEMNNGGSGSFIFPHSLHGECRAGRCRTRCILQNSGCQDEGPGGRRGSVGSRGHHRARHLRRQPSPALALLHRHRRRFSGRRRSRSAPHPLPGARGRRLHGLRLHRSPGHSQVPLS